MDIKPEKVLIMGCGGVGLPLVNAFSELGLQLYAQLRSESRAEMLRSKGIAPIIADLDKATLPDFPSQDALIYYFIPPASGGENQNQAGCDVRLERFLKQAECARHIVYISTTGVYGDCHGEWVTEQRPLNPQSASSLRRVAAEQQLYDFHLRYQVSVTILRVAAIYGRDRLPVERLRRADPVLKRSLSHWSNRIHIDDLVQICLAAGQAQSFKGQKLTWQVYNVSDGQPSSMTDYFLQVAQLLGLPQPKELTWAEAEQFFSAAMLVYLRESKRIDNRRMLEELKITLRYPSSELGLADSIESADILSKKR